MLPTLEEQQAIVKKLESVQTELTELLTLGKQNQRYILLLKEAILQEAIQGKLVPQDPNNEPANVLLKRITAEKQGLIKAGTLKPQKPLHPVTEAEHPFTLPDSWVWVRLGELCKVITDGTHYTPNYLAKGMPFISVKDINGSSIDFSKCKYISKEEHELINKRCNPELNDILICRIGTLGRATLVDTSKKFSLFVSVGLLKFNQKHILPLLFHKILHSPLLKNQYQEIKVSGSHTDKLNLRDLPFLKIPLPPLAEQQRIVAKVGELMALCDALEAHLTQQQAHATALLNSLVHELVGVGSL